MHRLLVVCIAGLDAEDLLQFLGGVDRVADPLDVADVELVALREVDVYAYALGVDGVDRVREDRGVAVALRVVEVDEQVLVLLVVLLVELGVLEEVDALLVGLLERAAQAALLELGVAAEGDAPHAHLLVAVDAEGDVDHVLAYGVVLDAGRDIHIAESFRYEVLLDELLVLVDDVVREFGSGLELEFVHKVLLLAAAYVLALERPAAHARPLLKEDIEVDAVALDLGTDLHIGEVTLVPQTRYGVRYEGAGQIERIARYESRRR